MSTDDLVRLGNRSTTSRSSRTASGSPCPAPAPRSGPSARSRAGSSSPRLAGVAFLVAFIAWPWEYRGPGEEGGVLYALYTPVIGFLFGLSVFAVGMGVIAYSKKLLPEDLTIQQRHDGRSAEVERRTAAARLIQTGSAERHRTPQADLPVDRCRRRRARPRRAGRRLRRARQEPVEGGAQLAPAHHGVALRGRRARLPASRHRRVRAGRARATRRPRPGRDRDGLPVQGVRARRTRRSSPRSSTPPTRR